MAKERTGVAPRASGSYQGKGKFSDDEIAFASLGPM